MTAQQRIDAILLTLEGGIASRIAIAFVAMPMDTGIMVEHDARTVHVSEAWVDASSDDMLRFTIMHEYAHRAAYRRMRYDAAGDAIVDWALGQDRCLASAGNDADPVGIVGEVDPTRFQHIVATGMSISSMDDQLDRFLHFRIKNGSTEAILSLDNDVADGKTAEERMRELVERMTDAGYEISVIAPVRMDLSGSMIGHFDGPAISAELDEVLGLRMHGISPRNGHSAVLIEGDMPLKRVAVRAMLAAGAPMAETFSRQDENDRWNRSQGRRGGGRRKGR